MSVAQGSTPTAALAGKRCLEGTSALSVSIHFPVKGTKGTHCHVGRKTYLMLQQMTRHFIILWDRSSDCWVFRFLLLLFKAGLLQSVPFSAWPFIFCQAAAVPCCLTACMSAHRNNFSDS